MNVKNIKIGLKSYDQVKVDAYIDYLENLRDAKDKKNQLKNPWFGYKKDEELVSFFKKVSLDGLTIDGVHITLQSTGISYDFVAFRNKMLLVYPETNFDHSLVYKDDTFQFEKQSGKVVYTHKMNNPFEQKEENIIGGYCIIKNKRGEFITTLSMANIQKHRKVAKTDKIWASWFAEMCLKTIIKKACKQHFQDIYQNITTLDNESIDLEKPLGIEIEDKSAVEKIETLDALSKFYHANKGRNAGVLVDFNKMVSNRKKEIEEKAEAEERKKAEEVKKGANVDCSTREPGMEG